MAPDALHFFFREKRPVQGAADPLFVEVNADEHELGYPVSPLLIPIRRFGEVAAEIGITLFLRQRRYPQSRRDSCRETPAWLKDTAVWLRVAIHMTPLERITS